MTNEPQSIEEIPNTVNPPVLFENLIETEKDGNAPEKAVEKLDGQIQQQMAVQNNMVVPKTHEARAPNKKLKSQRKEEFMVHYRNAGEMPELVAGQHLQNQNRVVNLYKITGKLLL